MDVSNLRVWLVHDWLTGWRGGEKILLELVRMFPRARIATLIHVPGASHPEIDARVARTSFLQNIPGIAKHYRNLLPLFPAAIRKMHLDADCDLILSISHSVAKAIRPPPGVPHICYCNTPMRYIWGMEDQYVSKHSPKRFALKLLQPWLRRFDRDTRNVSLFIGNSINVANRIRRFYQRDALVVYAGIDHNYFTPLPTQPREDFYLCAGALVPYKRIDLAIAAIRTTSRRLIIIGTGPEDRKLRALAGAATNITFLGRQPDDVLRDHYRRSRAFLFPGEEDFGLTPVEAQACGAPVIAYRAGGVLETVSDQPGTSTGIFFDHQSANSLTAAITKFESIPAMDMALLRDSSLRFTWENFRSGITATISGVLAPPNSGDISSQIG